jgi:hypothetical protein
MHQNVGDIIFEVLTERVVKIGVVGWNVVRYCR